MRSDEDLALRFIAILLCVGAMTVMMVSCSGLHQKKGGYMEIVFADFEKEVLSKDVALVNVWSDGCGHCNKVAPALEALEKEGIPVFKMKVTRDGSTDIEKNYQVRSTPTILVFKKGKYFSRQVGSFLQTSSLEEQVAFLKEGIEKGFLQKPLQPQVALIDRIYRDLGFLVVQANILGTLPLPTGGKIGEALQAIGAELNKQNRPQG